MKKKFRKSELGSVMIEALAMLALIALVTPMLYKKSAERTTELQDINAAGEMRSIIKAVDDYVSANYDAISQGKTVTNSCSGTGNNSHDYNDFKDASEAAQEVNLGHFCEFLPYGILNNDGSVRGSRMFNDYKVVLKVKGTVGDEENPGDRVITAFVITDPQNDELPTIRASSIASMIGGNGGFVNDVSGEGEDATGSISGNLGIWGIANTKTELGIGVKKGAVVAASIQGISSQNAKIDIDGVLYRVDKPEQNHMLNTMATTLYMGAAGSDTVGNDIVNIGHLAIGAVEGSSDSDALYIKTGDIRIGADVAGEEGSSSGNIYLDGTGNISLAGGNVIAEEGALVAGSVADDGSVSGVQITSSGEINANNIFKVATTGAMEALSGIFGYTPAAGATPESAAVSLNVSDVSTFNQPVQIEADGNCTYSDDTESISGNCALKVLGNTVVTGDLTIGDSFSAKNLHAREKLTVGGDDADDGKALSVTYGYTEASGDTATLTFGNNLFQTALMNTTDGISNGYLYFSDFVEMSRTGGTTAPNRTVTIGKDTKPATSVKMQTLNSLIEMTESGTSIIGEGGNSGIDINSIAAVGAPGGEETPGYYIDLYSGSINLNGNAFRVYKDSSKDNVISSIDSFKIRPESATDDTKGFFEVRTKETGETRNIVDIDNLDTYMTDGNQYVRNGTIYLQKGTAAEGATSYSDGLRMAATTSPDTGTNPATQISADEIYMKNLADDSTNVVKFDLTNTETKNTGNVPVYIRKGAIELRDGIPQTEADPLIKTTDMYNNYVQGEYFVSTKRLESNALVNGESESHYHINPGYTSVMHDIKLTSRGGARLSDILPDFINKGIYVVDNTYPAMGYKCNSSAGLSLSDYKSKSLKANKGEKNISDSIGTCSNIYQEVSPWAGFVPSPTCPPGYSKVITLTPASISMAQAGVPYSDENKAWEAHPDLSVPYVVKSPYDYLDGSRSDAAPTPLYYQKNTWLKSFVDKYEESGKFKGWDVGMGFIYPYNLYKDYIGKAGGINTFDKTGEGDATIIWNMFPVYAGTLEGYATVYCYFNRTASKAGGGAMFNASLVDTEYDQIEHYRDPSDHSDGTKPSDYVDRLNDNRGKLNAW